MKTLRLAVLILLLAALMFLLPSPYMVLAADFAPLPMDASPGPLPNSALYSEDLLNYKDASITVTGGQGRRFDTNYIYLRIRLSDPSQLRTAAAGNFNSTSATLGRAIAKRQNAVAAINGDYFVMDPYAVAIRQGKMYRNKPTGEDLLMIDSRGDFHIPVGLTDKEAVQSFLSDLENKGTPIVNAFTFGPMLVKDGLATVPDSKDYSYYNVGAQVYAQRISFSQLGELDYLVVATEGPDNENSRGMTLYEIAKTTELVGKEQTENGCILSYNLDGGSSSTVIMNNQKINAPGAKSRHINDIIYFATLVK